MILPTVSERRIVELFRDGRTYLEIHEITGHCRATIRRVCQRAGFRPQTTGNRRKPVAAKRLPETDPDVERYRLEKARRMA